MTLFERDAFEAFLRRLPHVEIVRQWGDSSVGKVGLPGAGKIFAILSEWSTDAPAISFKCSEMSFSMLPELEGVRPAPYLARAKWVQVAEVSALAPDEIEAYMTEAHRLIFESLPKRQRAALT